MANKLSGAKKRPRTETHEQKYHQKPRLLGEIIYVVLSRSKEGLARVPRSNSQLPVPSSPLPAPRYPLQLPSCQVPCTIATNGIFIDISVGSLGSRMLKYARHLLILFGDCRRSRWTYTCRYIHIYRYIGAGGAARDLRRKLKARAMHINSNLDRRIKVNDCSEQQISQKYQRRRLRSLSCLVT